MIRTACWKRSKRLSLGIRSQKSGGSKRNPVQRTPLLLFMMKRLGSTSRRTADNTSSSLAVGGVLAEVEGTVIADFSLVFGLGSERERDGERVEGVKSRVTLLAGLRRLGGGELERLETILGTGALDGVLRRLLRRDDVEVEGLEAEVACTVRSSVLFPESFRGS